MYAKFVAIGIMAFVTGLVFLLNFGNIFPSGGYYPTNQTPLVVMMFSEFFITFSILGGIVLILRASNVHIAHLSWIIGVIIILLILGAIFSIGVF